MKNMKEIDLAQDRNTQAEVLDQLFGVSKTVDEHLAIHPNASPELLLRLANQAAKKIRMFALLNPGFSPDLLSSVRNLTLTDLIYSSASSKMTPSQISEVFELLDFSKARTILKRPDCPENILMWALDNGTDSDRASISKRKYLHEKVREKLLSFGGPLATVASKPREMMVNNRGCIFGDFQKHVEINSHLKKDISSTASNEIQGIIDDYEYNSRKIFHIDSAPQLLISNINKIESLIINVKYIGDSYLLIENLPHLKVLELYDDVKKFTSWGLKWLVCRNLPSLEKVVINCKLRWIEFEGVPELRSACLNGSKELAYLAILGKNNLESLDVIGCKHLREVVFSDPEKHERLNVSSKILDVQNKSRDIVKLSSSMTFTEVDKAFEVVNEGFKIAVRNNLLKKMDDGVDLCYGRENDPDFRPFSFRVLRPLEPVYTGGTGENYVFEQLSHDYLNGNYGVWSSMGCHSPEDCLKQSLQTIIGFTVGVKSPAKLFDFFVNLVSREKDGVI